MIVKKKLTQVKQQKQIPLLGQAELLSEKPKKMKKMITEKKSLPNLKISIQVVLKNLHLE